MATSETFLIQRVEKSGTPSSPNDTANPMSSATNSSEDNKGPPSSSLPVGAKAAIGVSVPVALILLGIAASFFWRRKARRTSPRKEGPHPASQARYEKPELDARAEVGARVVGNTHLAEVDGREKASGPVELDGAHIEPGKAV
jgi:hypothetical protein